MPYAIQATRYDRLSPDFDSYAFIMRNENGSWTLRCMYGAAWAYNKVTKDWAHPQNALPSPRDIELGFEDAVELLGTVKTKAQIVKESR